MEKLKNNTIRKYMPMVFALLLMVSAVALIGGKASKAYALEPQEAFVFEDKTITYEPNGSFTLEVTGGSTEHATVIEVTAGTDVVTYAEGTFTILKAGDFTIQATKAGDETYDPLVETKQYTVEKAKVDAPTLSGTYEYTGEEQTAVLDGFDDTIFSVSGNKQTNAGGYTVVVGLLDPVNYEWTDGGSADQNISWTIGTAKVEIPTLDGTYTYTGEELTAELNGFDDTIFSVSGNKQTNAGDYTVVVGLLDSVNYEWTEGGSADQNISWTIETAKLTQPTLDGAYEFTGAEQTAALENFDEELMNILLDSNKATAIGTHTIQIELKDTANYEWAGGGNAVVEIAWTIQPIQTAVPVIDGTYTYTGQELTAVLDGFDDTLMVILNSNKATAAGTYTIEIDLLDKATREWATGGTDTLQIEWTIAPAQVAVPTLNGTYIFTGAEQTADINGLDETLMTVLETSNKATAIGTYTIRIDLIDNQNYEWATGGTDTLEITWVIAPIPVALPVVEGTYVYTGQELTADLTGFDPALMMIVDTSNKATNAGTHLIKFDLLDPTIYEWAAGGTATLEIEWTIAPIQVTVPTLNGTYTYTGQEQTADLDGFDPERMNVLANTNKATYAGTHTIEIELIDAQNYAWTTGNSNVLEIAWVIAPIQVAAPVLSGSYTYNGEAQTADISQNFDEALMSVLNESNQATGAGTHTIEIDLLDKVNYVWATEDSGSDTFKIEWIIKKLQLAAPSTKALTYNGAAQDVVLIGFDEATMSLGEGSSSGEDVGAYIIGIVLNDPDNYEWQTGSSEPYPLGWYIYAIKVAVPTVGAYTYTGAEQTASLNGFDPEIMTITAGTDRATDAGTYSIGLSLVDRTNYQWAIGGNTPIEIEWVISKVRLTKPTASQLTYTGAEQTAPFTSFDGDALTVTGTQKATAAGTYTATFSINDTDNYEWADGTNDDAEIAWSIAKAKVAIPSISGTYTFSGTEQTVALTGFDNDTMTVLTDSNKATNAGTHAVKIALKDADNYEWAAAFSGELSWVIAKAPITLGMTVAGFTFGQTASVPVVTGNNSGTAVTFGYASTKDGTYTPITNLSVLSAGSYWLKATLAESSNYLGNEAFANFVIAKAKLSKPALTGTYAYTGSQQTATLSGFDNTTMSVSGNTATAAGTYSIQIALNDEKNYEWSDAFTGRIVWIVEKAEAALKPADIKLEVVKKTKNSVALKEIAGVEYSADEGKTWQLSPVFNNLDPKTSYKFIARFAGTENYLVGEATQAFEVKTSNAGLSGGAIAGIIVGVVVLLGAAYALLHFLVIKKRVKK